MLVVEDYTLRNNLVETSKSFNDDNLKDMVFRRNITSNDAITYQKGHILMLNTNFIGFRVEI